MRKCLIIIPAFNAADTLPELLCRLSRFVDPTAILVVDDGSADGTADVAHRAGVGVLRH
ncbi:MAG: glycosyltransferase, partial [Ignavibacteria bacterium]|nr:glycosyltransferase [Ignavibacteria bacterium]